MFFNELIKSNHWLSTKEILLSLYPDQEESIDAYEDIYQKLLKMEQSDSDMQIVLTECFDDETGEPSYIDVAGAKSTSADSDNETSWAIEFVPWKEWLGMRISAETQTNFNPLEIIAHCLYEMTFIGFKETDIQNNLSNIKNITEEFINMTSEEIKLLRAVPPWH